MAFLQSTSPPRIYCEIRNGITLNKWIQKWSPIISGWWNLNVMIAKEKPEHIFWRTVTTRKSSFQRLNFGHRERLHGDSNLYECKHRNWMTKTGDDEEIAQCSDYREYTSKIVEQLHVLFHGLTSSPWLLTMTKNWHSQWWRHRSQKR